MTAATDFMAARNALGRSIRLVTATLPALPSSLASTVRAQLSSATATATAADERYRREDFAEALRLERGAVAVASNMLGSVRTEANRNPAVAALLAQASGNERAGDTATRSAQRGVDLMHEAQALPDFPDPPSAGSVTMVLVAVAVVVVVLVVATKKR